VKTISQIKQEIDALPPLEQEELLNHIASRLAADRASDTQYECPKAEIWAAEAESDAQYVIPELGYHSSTLLP
jgi:hypothetical protein